MSEVKNVNDNENEELIDEETILENADSFSCPACGGKMHFNVNEQSLSCPYCDNKIEITSDSEPIKEYDFDKADELASKGWGNETRIIRCESCGAQVVLEENATAQFCSFCGSSNVVKEFDSDCITPESLIPFKISKAKASDNFKKWLKKRFFAPRKLKKKQYKDNFSGLYLPFWTYDSQTSSFYTAQKGTYYYVTRTRMVNGKPQTYRQRKIRWKRVQGTYNKFFDDVLVNASKNHDRNIIEVLEPFNLKGLVPYRTEYLSGFIAERYSINLKNGWHYAKNKINGDIRNGIIAQVNGDEVRIESVNTSYDDVKYKHILLPIWMSSYKYKDKIYRFMVNAQTGEVQGKYPKSPLKITLTVLASLGIVGLIIYFFSTYN